MSLRVDALSFRYERAPVLEEVSFTAGKGELVAVMGPNGAGKSTLFRCILGLEKKYKGSIRLDDREVRSMDRRSLAHAAAAIPQATETAFRYRVEDMVLMGTAHRISPLASPGPAERAAAREAMERLGIEHLADKSFDRISGGERQLVLVARALAQQAGVLLMDEPTSSLDYGNQLHVLTIARTLARDGYTVLLSTHDPQHALWYADRALVLLRGRVHAWGTPEQVVTEALMETLYKKKARLLATEQGAVLVPERESLPPAEAREG